LAALSKTAKLAILPVARPVPEILAARRIRITRVDPLARSPHGLYPCLAPLAQSTALALGSQPLALRRFPALYSPLSTLGFCPALCSWLSALCSLQGA